MSSFENPNTITSLARSAASSAGREKSGDASFPTAKLEFKRQMREGVCRFEILPEKLEALLCSCIFL